MDTKHNGIVAYSWSVWVQASHHRTDFWYSGTYNANDFYAPKATTRNGTEMNNNDPERRERKKKKQDQKQKTK